MQQSDIKWIEQTLTIKVKRFYIWLQLFTFTDLFTIHSPKSKEKNFFFLQNMITENLMARKPSKYSKTVAEKLQLNTILLKVFKLDSQNLKSNVPNYRAIIVYQLSFWTSYKMKISLLDIKSRSERSWKDGRMY